MNLFLTIKSYDLRGRLASIDLMERLRAAAHAIGSLNISSLSGIVDRLAVALGRDDAKEFRLLKYFSFLSGAVFLAFTVLSVALYRHAQYKSFVADSQENNVTLARTISNSVWARHGDYLSGAAQIDPATLLERPETESLNTELRLTTAGTRVFKLKIYASNGLTVFSTDFSQIGDSKSSDLGFIKLLASQAPSSTISHRETFAAVTGIVRNVTLLETYVPIVGIDGRVKAVFELYTDFTPYLDKIFVTSWQVAGWIIAGFSGLYLLLYCVVARADRILTTQAAEVAGFNAKLEERVASRTHALQLANTQIATLNSSLESRVAERTLELKQAHEDVTGLNVELAKRVLELKDAQDQIIKKGKLAQLGQLTATVAHEIRNPLGAIKTSAQLVERKLKGQDLGLEKALGRINNGIHRCDYIITELLDFARSKVLVVKEVRMDDWVRTIVDEETRNVPNVVKVECDLQLGARKVEFDADRMRRVLVNLISNAAEAMVGKGSEPALANTTNPRIIVSTRVADGNVELIVEDNGPGISEENMRKILEPLFTTKAFGVGLGLSAVEKILEQHAGGLRIESEIGKGAAFTAWFPLGFEQEQAA